MALVVGVWRLSFSCCDQVAKLGLGFQPLVHRQRSVARLQTLESLLGIQRAPFKLFLLIFFAHCNRRSGFFFSVGNGNNLKGGSQSHMLAPFLQP